MQANAFSSDDCFENIAICTKEYEAAVLAGDAHQSAFLMGEIHAWEASYRRAVDAECGE